MRSVAPRVCGAAAARERDLRGVWIDGGIALETPAESHAELRKRSTLHEPFLLQVP